VGRTDLKAAAQAAADNTEHDGGGPALQRSAARHHQPDKMHMIRQNSEDKHPRLPIVRILDPDPLGRSAVAEIVRTMNFAQRQFATGRELLAALQPEEPGCVVLELRLSDVNGLDVQRQIAARTAGLPVVFLTAHATVSIAVQAIRAGAVHFLQKPARDAELWNAIQEAVECDHRRRLADHSHEQMRQRMAGLTAAEWQLMERLAAGKPNRVIAGELGVATRTVEVRRAKLMRKLEVKSYMQFLRLAVEAGLFAPQEGEFQQAHK
jgi:two-component system response regulator FixJ